MLHFHVDLILVVTGFSDYSVISLYLSEATWLENVMYENSWDKSLIPLYLLLLHNRLLFRCGAQQFGDLGSSSGALDGILGFGQSNSSMISQLASAGKVRKMFSHCLDSVNGGGIFAIGQVVQPKVNTTPLIPNQYAAFVFYFIFQSYVFCCKTNNSSDWNGFKLPSFNTCNPMFWKLIRFSYCPCFLQK